MDFEKMLKKEEKLVVVGLGYVGLPIALEFARKIKVIGFDVKQDRVEMMKNKKDPSYELPPEAFEGCDIHFTSSKEDIKEGTFYIVTVPTPIDSHNLPDLKPLLRATETVGDVLKKGDYVVYESTVYPGCTEEDCVPILEERSGLQHLRDFKTGYSPERINPGDSGHTLTKIIKVVSGCDKESLENIAGVYELIIQAGVYKAGSIKVAEAAKVIENTQRDVNIALMNELSIIFNRMEINTYEVLEAAGTKWNFLNFFPGLVGGHCIGVDPYYLAFKAREYGYHAQIINTGRFINDTMGRYVAKQTVKLLIAKGKNLHLSRILIMGVTFKENVADIRNSRVADIYQELLSYGINADVVDPNAKSAEVEEEYGFQLKPSPEEDYDAIIVAVNHDEYMELDENYFRLIGGNDPVLIDVKGIYRGKIKEISYWSL